MDLFLSEILTRLREKKTISEILTCCTPGLAGTLLSCELLSDVHQLCQQPGQHEDDTRPLRNFLLSGRGARCLLTLHALGTQGISCGRELASLLISLYPLFLQSPDADEISGNNEFFTPESNLDIESVFKLNVHTRAKGWSLGSLHPRLSNGSVTSSTRYHRKRSSAGSAALASATSESDEELADVEGDLSPLAPTLRIQLNPMDFDYFTSVIRSEDEGEKKRSDHAKKPEDFMHDNLIPAMNIKLSVLELYQLLVSLIRKLCVSEPTDSTCQTSVQAINFSLENLCALQFGSANLGSELQVAELKYSLVYLLLTSLERTLQHSDAINTVMQSGMFPMLLRVIEDAVRKSMQPQDNLSEQEVTQRKEFIYATLYGALTLLQSLLQKHEKFKDFMELFRVLSDSQGGHLIENSISILLSNPNNSSTIRAKKVVAQVGSILVSLKRVRAEVVHAKQCKRHRHKQCGIPANERFHHLEIIGRTQGSVGSTCSVATLFSVLVRIAQGCGNAEVENRAIRVITQSGACCCIPPRALLLPVLEMVRRPDFGVRTAAFTLLEKVLFAELGGSGETPASPSACAVCGTQVLSLLISSDSTSEETMGSNIMQGNNWDCLELYKTLLESQDYQLCVSIVEHIFKTIPFTSSTVKHSLLFKVFYPAFLNQKIQFFDDKSDEIPKYLLQCCLSILSSQLCNITFAEEFISRGGLDHILELISMPEFSKLCCSILEVTVVIELWRNSRDEDVATPSLLMLLKALETSAASLISCLQRIVTKQQQRYQQGEDLMHATESDSGCLTEPTDSSDSCETASKNTLLEQLSSFVVFWRACASLVACSPPFRAHLSSHELVTQALKLLHLVTKQAVRGPSPGEEDYGRGTEAFLILRLLEALLIICLGVESPSESQLGNSVHECGEVLTGVRQAVMAMKPHGRSHVQALSEVLLRCAATHYFEHQVLPTRSKPEVL
ncbi:hypothetical protein B566_EDAN012733 [Ephemera danica]|nr:hypothetical protein B566_EDAN012733 [Ephemera danica]